MADSRKTKKELLEEIAKLRKEVERVEQYKQMEDCAVTLKMQYDALKEAGFTDEQAFDTFIALIKQSGGVR